MTQRLEIYKEEDITKIYMHLMEIEDQGITLGKIDKDTNIFTCDMDKVPLQWVGMDHHSIENCAGVEKPFLYRIRGGGGDILHSIRIYGPFKSARVFQYGYIREIAYDNVEQCDTDEVVTIMPFPNSGFPRLQVRTNIYLEIIPFDHNPIPKFEICYGYLDTKLRRQFNITSPYQEEGVSVIHRNGDKYTAFGVDQQGYSINLLHRNM